MAEVTPADWLNAIPAAILLQQDDRIVFANSAATLLSGYADGELLGVQTADVIDSLSGSGQLKKRSGTAVNVTVTCAAVDHERKPAQLITIQPVDANPYRVALEHNRDSFYLMDCIRDEAGELVDLICVDANTRGFAQSTLPPDQLIGHSLRQLFIEHDTLPLFKTLISLIEQRSIHQSEAYIDHPLLETGWYQTQLIPVGDQVAIFERDITLRKESEEVVEKLALEVEQQVRMLDEILAATPDAFLLFDRDGHYLYVNRRGLEDSGLTTEQVTGKTWRELGFPQEAGLIFDARLKHVLKTEQSITYEEQFPTLEGLRDFMITLTPIHDKDGDVIFMLNTIRDITEQKASEEELRKLATELERQARVFDTVLSTTPDTFLMFDRESRFMYASPSALRNVQLKPQWVVGKTWQELGLPGESSAAVQAHVDQVFASGESVTFEEVFSTAQSTRQYESIFTPLHNDDDTISAVVVTSRDITERKLAEEALRESQRLFTSIYESALVGICVIDAQGIFVQVNHTYCEIYGYSATELIGKHFTFVFPEESHTRAESVHQNIIQSALPNETMSEWVVKRKDGTAFEISAYNSLLVQENGERFRVVVIIDVSEQRRAQRALEASEQRLMSILSSMQDVVWSVQPGTHELVYVNPTIETFSGYSPADILTNHRLLIDIVHEQDRVAFAAQLDGALLGERIDMDYRIVRRDGALRWVHNRFWLVCDAQDRPLRIDGIMTDITDRRQASDHAMQLALERERVRILSEFVRDASHEFRTPLSIINTRLYLMEKVKDPIKQAEYAEGIKEQTERILQLVESLITMSRLDTLTDTTLEAIDLNHLLTSIKMNIEAAAQHKEITFTLELAPERYHVWGDMEELMTLFKAVLDNAVTYTPEGGEVSVRCHLLNDHEIAVDVRDTGAGISEDDLPHIFDRFFRADHARSMRGFGLGLTIAQKISQRHSGRIEVESEVGKGSRFRLIFPCDKPMRRP